MVSIGGGLLNGDACGALGTAREFCQLPKLGFSSRMKGDGATEALVFCNEDAILVPQKIGQRHSVQKVEYKVNREAVGRRTCSWLQPFLSALTRFSTGVGLHRPIPAIDQCNSFLLYHAESGYSFMEVLAISIPFSLRRTF